MRLRAAALGGAVVALCSTALDAQPVRMQVRTALARFGALTLTVCPGDPPPAEWRRRIREEFNDPTMTLYEPSGNTRAIEAELRVVLRAAGCDPGAEAYELFITDGRGEAAQSLMLRVAGVPRDERPQVAAVRIAEVYRTHRRELVGADPPPRTVLIPLTPREEEAASSAWDVEVGVAGRYVPSSYGALVGPHLAVGHRSTPDAPLRLRGEAGFSLLVVTRETAGLFPYRVWLAFGASWDVVRARGARLALGGRGEVALNAIYPTIALGLTIEAQVAVPDRRWLVIRADLGGHVVGAQVETYRDLGGGLLRLEGVRNIAEGVTAALTVGVLFGR